METLHHFNIGLHIGFGTLAMLLGLVPMLRPNGGRWHVGFGRWFLRAMSVVLTTAVLGLVVFNFRPFLVGITLLSLYLAWGGYRAVRQRRAGPTGLDAAVAGLFLAGGLTFLLCLPRIALVWTPGVIYSTLGTLLAFALYDLARPAFRKLWCRRLWLFDHLWKMISAYFALVAAFTGSVLERYKPYSQFGPSVLGIVVALGFVWYFARRARPLPAAPLR